MFRPAPQAAAFLLVLALSGGAIATPPQTTVEGMISQLHTCEDLDCPWVTGLIRHGEAVWPKLAAGLATDQPEMTRFWALGVLSEVKVPAAHAELVRLLEKDRTVRIRAAAAFALGNQGDVKLAAHLAKALSDPDVNVRFEAASALGRLPSKGAVPALLGVIRDRDEDVRAAVIEALTAAGDPAAGKAVLRRLKHDRSARVRGLSAIALANFGTTDAGPLLVDRLATERDAEALAAACWAVGELRVVDAKGPLERLAAHKDATVKRLAAEALAKISTTPAPKAPKGR